MTSESTVKRTSDREILISRTLEAPAQLVFDAWSKPELFKTWWVPEGAPMTLTNCELDVRTGGSYRLSFLVGSETMDFFGKYLEVTPPSKIKWTNDEGGEKVSATTTVTIEESSGRTRITVHDLYPSKAELDHAIANGSTSGWPVQLEQLGQLLKRQGRR